MPHFSQNTVNFMQGIATGQISSNLLVGGMVRVKEDVEDQLKAINATIAEKLKMDGEDDVWAIKIPSGQMNRLGEITGISFVEMDVAAPRRRIPKKKTQAATGDTLGEKKGGKLVIIGGVALMIAALFYVTQEEWM